MELRIGKYKITTDKYNFMLEEEIIPKRKRSESGGQPYWNTISYHPTLEFACVRMLQHKVKNEDVDDVQSIIDCITSSTESIVDAIKTLKKVPKIES
jgi:hypothetical protein